jgi:uncharacterized membrane protein
MPPPVTSRESSELPPWARAWLPAGDLPLDGGRVATVSFDRDGNCRLLLALDHAAGPEDVSALEEAADALPYLQLSDLEGSEGYPRRHAEAFALEQPLASFAFNSSAKVELVTPPGGRRLPVRVGAFGLAGVTTVTTSPGERDGDWPSDQARMADQATTTTHEDGETDGELDPEAGVEGGATESAPTSGPAAAGAIEVQAQPAPEVGRLEAWLATVGQRLTDRTRLSGTTLSMAAFGIALAIFVGVFVAQTFGLYRNFGTYGFDLGIYDQGTWLLSRFHAPLVTVRGLNLFGEHASYILVLVAPLYHLWDDPRLLLVLQAVALAVPAWVVYRLGAKHLRNPAAGLAVAVAYLAYPAMQWALTWQFHPETLAAGFLALAALAADGHRNRQMAIWLGLALLCREDVGLAVAGFGGLLMLTGQRVTGRRVLVAGLLWWLLATFLFIPWANGRQTNLFELNYGVTGIGPVSLLRALPSMAGRALATALSNQGVGYLLLVLVPLLALPLLSPKALLPVAPALFLNLAAVPPEQHQIRYQYLAIVAPLLAIGAVRGLQVIAQRRRALLAPALIALVVVALAMDQRYGPAPWSHAKIVSTASPADAAKRRALAMIPAGAPVSAQFNLVTHLSHREKIFEFPNPFRSVNWGLNGDVHPTSDQEGLRYVIVDRSLLDQDQKGLLRDLQASPDWATRFDNSNVVLLQRRGSGGTP